MLQVLVATLNTKNVNQLIQGMNLATVPTILVNQSNQEIFEERLEKHGNLQVFESSQLGLSNSRNQALDLAENDSICQIADDDMVFVDNYERIVAKAYEEFPHADLIVFHVDRGGHSQEKARLKKGPVGFLASMKISSVQVTLKKASIVKMGITFDNRFGIGAKYASGEENIFLFDCLRQGLKIYSYPETIAKLTASESHWDRRITPENCRKRGAVYKRMSPNFYWAIILQFAIRKRKLCQPIGIFENIRYMMEGARTFSNDNPSK